MKRISSVLVGVKRMWEEVGAHRRSKGKSGGIEWDVAKVRLDLEIRLRDSVELRMTIG